MCVLGKGILAGVPEVKPETNINKNFREYSIVLMKATFLGDGHLDIKVPGSTFCWLYGALVTSLCKIVIFRTSKEIFGR
jgi:hypothetical protein